MYNLSVLSQHDIEGVACLLRSDLDVPLVDGAIDDETRLIASLPTIEYLLLNRASIVICGHLGRPASFIQNPLELPSSQEDFVELSLLPVAQWFAQKLRFRIKKGRKNGFFGWEIGGDMFLLENIRFYKGETENDANFAQLLASLAHIYINDAFAVSHRSHASIVGVTHYIPHVAGFRLATEVRFLEGVLSDPNRPLVVVMGGKKIETKLPLLRAMARMADYVLVGGKVSQEAERILVEDANGIHKDHIFLADQNKDKTDITKESVRRFIAIIKTARMIIWNGSMGIIQPSATSRQQSEREDTERGTREIANAIAKSRAFTLVGGGDTVEYLNRLKIADRFSFVSTGGGAMLALLSGEKLPGLEVLAT